jgi:hypothetical protein
MIFFIFPSRFVPVPEIYNTQVIVDLFQNPEIFLNFTRQRTSAAETGDEIFEIPGFHLSAGQCLFEWRKPQDDAEQRGHGPVAAPHPIVEQQVLEFAPFYRHNHGSVNRVDRSKKPRGVLLQANGAA